MNSVYELKFCVRLGTKKNVRLLKKEKKVPTGLYCTRIEIPK